MTGLRTRFEELAGADGPPTRLSADGVYRKAWRRHRRRRAVATAVVVAVAAGLALVTLRTGPDAAPPPPTQVRTGPVLSATATDAQHLYAGVRGCDGCPAKLLGSDDGGRTWTVRQEDFGDGQVEAPAPGVLMRTTNTPGDETGETGPKLIWHNHVSLDGGRTWRELVLADEEVSTVPPQGWLQCAPVRRAEDRCRLLAVDPVAGRMAPLASQPDLSVYAVSERPASPGMWVSGYMFSPDRRPVVAFTPDRGRTWRVHVFDQPGAELAVASSADGRTGYAVLSTNTDPDATPPARLVVEVQQTTDGGATWRPVDPGHTLPIGEGYYTSGDTYVAADGSHVVLIRDDRAPRWYVSSDQGRHYRNERPDGLPERITVTGLHVQVQSAVPGVYLAFDGDAVYRSEDGRRWTRIPVPHE
ncbi:sialidase family protein [Dactylosporangium sp. AC04546]|uniref:sialidase family protein n=1 Tax=Dactylosporangium sp. AC04546 TaxID=2862460 RepID=UPI001EDDD187|nr:sialidase family protein [Dactylosporangium sp. AC04546]WVK80159.1 sialidase family protein [Dactylosporangium sp. AC04546]